MGQALVAVGPVGVVLLVVLTASKPISWGWGAWVGVLSLSGVALFLCVVHHTHV